MSGETTPTLLQKGDGSAIPVPSGLAVRLIDVLADENGPRGYTLRFRFLVPELPGAVTQTDMLALDMHQLCQTFARPLAEKMQIYPAQFVISLADREVPYGETAPDAVQLFDAFILQDDACVQDLF